MNINIRLKEIIEYKKVSPRAFALEAGISPQRIGNYLKNREPDYDAIRRILETNVDISPRWLLTGQGEMLENPYPEDPRVAHSRIYSAIRPEEETLQVSESRQNYNVRMYGPAIPTSGTGSLADVYKMLLLEKDARIDELKTSIDNLRAIIRDKDSVIADKDTIIKLLTPEKEGSLPSARR